MKNTPQHAPPSDAQQRLDIEPVVCYPNDTLPPYDKPFYNNLQQGMQLVDSITIPARDARSFVVPAGHAQQEPGIVDNLIKATKEFAVKLA